MEKAEANRPFEDLSILVSSSLLTNVTIIPLPYLLTVALEQGDEVPDRNVSGVRIAE